MNPSTMNGTINGVTPRIPISQSPSATTPRSEISSVKSEGDLRSKASQQQLNAALQDWQLKSSTIGLANLQSNPPTFTSPCFFHRRFDDAVNLQKVLEEIAGDDGMSHSRLVLTATGVREIAKQLQRKPIKTAVRNIMIITKARDNNLVTLTRELAEWLLSTPRYGSATGVNVYVDDKLRQSKRFNAPGLLAQNPRFERMLRYWTPDLCWSSPQQFDLVVTLGGDGTVLFTSWLFQRIVPPVLSFSLGSLGFLTPFDFAHYQQHLNRVMGGTGNGSGSIPQSPSAGPDIISSPASVGSSSTPPESGMRISLRMRFTCRVYRALRNAQRIYTQTATSTAANSSPSIFPLRPYLSDEASQPQTPLTDVPQPEQFEVLNELVIDRGPSPYVSLLHLYGDGHPLTTIQADGLILSTPTGSTAYSLSAGGSLVHPDIPAILLTPICPHTLSFRPMLLNDTMLLTVKVPNSSRANAWCSFDGKGRVELRQGDSVDIKASRYPFPTVIGGKGDQWVDSISRTLRWNTRGVNQKSWGGGRSAVAGFEDDVPKSLFVDGEGGLSQASTQDEEDEEPFEAEEDYDIDIDCDDNLVDGVDSAYGGEESSSRAGNGTNSPMPGRKMGSMPYLSQLNI